MADTNRAQLTDDGTMDTVITCAECGHEERYNYEPPPDSGNTPERDYMLWLNSVIEEFDEKHECDEETE